MSTVLIENVGSVNSCVPSVSGSPPKLKANVVVPVPVFPDTAAFKSAISVQLVPLKDSVNALAGGVSPPKTNALLAAVPDPPGEALAVFISAISVQLVPFQDSFNAEAPDPV
jgi:hypothetical protein